MKLFSHLILLSVLSIPAQAQTSLRPPELITSEVLVSGYQPTFGFSDGIFQTESGKAVKLICGHNTLLASAAILMSVHGDDNRLWSKYDQYGRQTDLFRMEMSEGTCEAQVDMVLTALSEGRKVTVTASGYSPEKISIAFWSN